MDCLFVDYLKWCIQFVFFFVNITNSYVLIILFNNFFFHFLKKINYMTYCLFKLFFYTELFMRFVFLCLLFS